ncbi:Uncharacterized protein Rs2_35724 [Raphanus sativus]|nr:Uncharacterized protein Rs2_35724 [Raphanus sativus]
MGTGLLFVAYKAAEMIPHSGGAVGAVENGKIKKKKLSRVVNGYRRRYVVMVRPRWSLEEIAQRNVLDSGGGEGFRQTSCREKDKLALLQLIKGDESEAGGS